MAGYELADCVVVIGGSGLQFAVAVGYSDDLVLLWWSLDLSGRLSWSVGERKVLKTGRLVVVVGKPDKS